LVEQFHIAGLLGYGSLATDLEGSVGNGHASEGHHAIFGLAQSLVDDLVLWPSRFDVDDRIGEALGAHHRHLCAVPSGRGLSGHYPRARR
jgi:hypothetical protein